MTAPTISEEFVTTPAQLAGLVKHLLASGRFAWDTEFVSEDTFEPVLCLIQVATRERLAVIDPLAIADLTPFWNAVHNPDLEVVMHAAGEDLRICLLRTGMLPRRVFDVQIAAGLAGLSYPLSLVNLAGQVMDQTLSGSETRTDWRRRPLSPAQVQYALDDVRHLLDLSDRLRDRLIELGRISWADIEFSEFVAEIGRRGEEEHWRRLPGLHQLDRRGLEAARRLGEWREAEARRQNRPLRHVLRDDLLVAIARRRPSDERGLQALRDFNRPALKSKSHEILAILHEARAVPHDQLPELPMRVDDPPGLSTVTNLLSAALAQCCVRNEIAGSLVGTVGDLKQLVRWHLDGRNNSRPPVLLQGWRGDLCGRLLLDVLEGRLALRVVDPGSEFPVDFFGREPKKSTEQESRESSEESKSNR